MCSRLIVALSALATLAVPTRAAVIFVKADVVGANDGSSWVDAFVDPQSALNAAQAGDEIWVAAGTYRPRGVSRRGLGRTATFQLKSDVAIYGGFAGVEAIRERRDPERNETILSGDLIGDDDPTTAAADLIDDPTRQDNAFHVVTGSGTRASAMLDGFVITGGNANGTLGSETLRGGGMYNDRGTPPLANCTFSRNAASSVEEDGGGRGHVQPEQQPGADQLRVRCKLGPFRRRHVQSPW